MPESVIEVSHVAKSFKIYHDRPYTLKDRLLHIAKKSYTPFYALRDVDFTIGKGEAVGLIGHNGCGKSTLLKLLTRIIYPDSGKIDIKGRVSSLLELGAGFHPDFTGRENIYTNAAIFGLSRTEITDRLQSVIDFSELGEFIDNPVRTYSSGMYMRLAFSVAIHVNPEILLIDEILAVGDSNFQAKCMEQIRNFRERGVTIVIVSHDLDTISRICSRAIWLEDGVIRADGGPFDVTTAYADSMARKQQPESEEAPKESPFAITSFTAHHPGEEVPSLEFGPDEDVELRIRYRRERPSERMCGFVEVLWKEQMLSRAGQSFDAPGEEGVVTLRLPHVPLTPGRYQLDAILRGENTPETRARISLAFTSPAPEEGALRLAQCWSHTHTETKEGAAT